MERFAKIVNLWKPLTILPKHSTLDAWQKFEKDISSYQNSIWKYLFNIEYCQLIGF